MPSRRPPKKGSFGGHFDELVTHFPEERPRERDRPGEESKDDDDVHDKLFRSAWRNARGHDYGRLA